MRHRRASVCTMVVVAAAFALAGCTDQATPPRVAQVVPPSAASVADTPPDLADCVLLELLPSRGQSGFAGQDGRGGVFTAEQKAALAALFGREVAYERYEEIPYDNFYSGLVSAIVAPGRAVSLTYREPGWRWSPPRTGAAASVEGSTRPLVERTVWGFYPRLTSGRFPGAPGEAVIFGSEGHIGFLEKRGPDIGTPTAPRALGTRFRPALGRGSSQPTEFTVVGLADLREADEETIWLNGYPTEASRSRADKPWVERSSERASASLRDVNQYDRVRDAVAATGVRWRALRLRDGVVDTTWCHSGYDYAVPAVSAEFWIPDKPGASLHLSLGAYVSEGDYLYWPRAHERPAALPIVPVRELRLTYDGKAITPPWATEKHEPAGDNLKFQTQYRASVEVPRQEGQHKVAVYRSDRLIRVLILEFKERK